MSVDKQPPTWLSDLVLFVGGWSDQFPYHTDRLSLSHVICYEYHNLYLDKNKDKYARTAQTQACDGQGLGIINLFFETYGVMNHPSFIKVALAQSFSIKIWK